MLRPFPHRIRVLVAALAATALCLGLAVDASAAKKKAKKAPVTKVAKGKAKGKSAGQEDKKGEAAKTTETAKPSEPAKPSPTAEPAKPAAKADVTGLWNAECKKCHGADGKGKPNKTADMTTPVWQKSFTDAQIRQAIADGFERERDGTTQKMKGLKDATPAKLDGLVAYIRGLAK